VAFQTPDQPQIDSPIVPGFDAPRRSLLEMGITTSEGPDLAELRDYLAARQRAEELAAAEAAASAETSIAKRGRFRRQAKLAEVPDPQLRPVTWAVALRSKRRDIEDALVHRGLIAHAYVFNAASDSPAVCGYKPPIRRAMRGGRVARLAPAAIDTNPRCSRCLLLLYGAALAGETDPGRWPASDMPGAHLVEEVAPEPVAVAADDEARESYEPYQQPLHLLPLAVAEAVTDYEPAADYAAETDYAQAPDYSAEADVDTRVVIPIEDEWEVAEDESEPGVATGYELEVADEETEEAEDYAPAVAAMGIVDSEQDPLEELVSEGVEDVLVVAIAGRTALIAGGIGRGADWAGTVLSLENEPLLLDALASPHPLRQESHESQRIVGPFWSHSAALVPVSDTGCVVFSSSSTLLVSDEALRWAALGAAVRFEQPPVDAVLDDERELSIAVQRMMEGAQLASFEAALDHVLNTAAGVLGCSIAAGVARMGRRLAMRSIDLDGADALDPALVLGEGPLLASGEELSIEELPIHDHQSPAIIARLRVPLSGPNVSGTLVLTHTHRRPRGFTTQDQRLAQAMAPAAALVLERAGFGEGMQALESHLRSAPSTDTLTGLANRAAWEEALGREAARLGRRGGVAAVAGFRLDGLARIDERQGPVARDAALRAAAELVRSVCRSSDIAARVSDDEFRILLRDPGRQGGRRLATRMRRAVREAQDESGEMPPVSVSWANAASQRQLLAANRLVAQRLRYRARQAEPARLGSGR
jgi:diguanylate cyclase (GGDEF)-like protein